MEGERTKRKTDREEGGKERERERGREDQTLTRLSMYMSWFNPYLLIL